MERNPRPSRMKWIAIAIFTTIITFNGLLYYYWWQVPRDQAIFAWLGTTLLVLITSIYAFQRYDNLQRQADAQLKKIQKQHEYQKALSLLSSVFATTHEEDAIYAEIVRRLGQLHRYDYVGVYEVMPDNRRVMRQAYGPIMPEDPVLLPGQGISERVLFDGKLHYCPDVTKEPTYAPGLGTGSEIDAPIRYQDQILGVIMIESAELDAFSQEDFDLISAAADQTATAIKNAQLFSDALASTERLIVLHRVSQEVITAGTDPERLYQTIHHAALQLMPCDAFVISLLSEDKEEIDAVYLIDRDGRAPARRIAKDSGLSGYVISSGKAVLEHNYFQGNGLKNVNVIHFGNPENTLAVLAVPMRLGDDVFGMLSAQSYESYIYSQEDQNLLEMLAAYAAIALANANLFNEVQRLAVTDSLTGISNRRNFFEIARREFARSKRYGYPYSVIMIDLDNYKEINDKHGHTVGDLVLKEVAHRLKEKTRTADLLGRYGGDEFAISLPETGTLEAIQTAERLRSDMAMNPIDVDGGNFIITISAGISSLTETTEDLIRLLRFADEALYEAKAAGKNCIRSRA